MPPRDTHGVILRFIRDYSRDHGFPPSIQEISAEVRLTPSTIHFNLGRMAAKGYITWETRKPRTVVLTDEGHFRIGG